MMRKNTIKFLIFKFKNLWFKIKITLLKVINYITLDKGKSKKYISNINSNIYQFYLYSCVVIVFNAY